MDQSLITTLAIVIISFLSAFTGLKLRVTHNAKSSFWVLWSVLLASWIILDMLTPNKTDFITAFYPWELPTIGLISAGLYLLLKKYSRFSIIILLIGAELGSFTLPSNGFIFNESLNFWADRGILILLWTIYAYCFNWLKTTDGIIGIQSLGTLAGITGLSVINAAPNFIGMMSLCGISVFGAWQLFNRYPAQQKFSTAESWAIGFILGWINLKAATEGAGSCLLCFNMFYAYEIFICTAYMFLHWNKAENPAINSDFYRVSLSGLSPAEITTAVSKLFLLLIVFGGFSAFTPNAYSLPLFSLITCVWFFYRLNHWQETLPTLKEINTKIITDFKSNVSDIAGGFKPKD